MPGIYKDLLRPLLFRGNAEKVHELGLNALRVALGSSYAQNIAAKRFKLSDALDIERFGLKFSNPVGIAAGFDKNAVVVDQLAALGFGFVEIGTVTRLPQPGNEKPRMFRLPVDNALINRLGFNNLGAAAAAQRLAASRRQCVIGVNIGKNKAVPNEEAVTDYIACLETVYECADYIAVNVSSPNTPNLRELQEAKSLEDLLKALTAKIKELAGEDDGKPLLLKIAPDLTMAALDDVIAICREQLVDGIIATNTTISRDGLKTDRLTLDSIGEGGVSGAPLRTRSNEVIKHIFRKTDGLLPVIGVGGVFSASDAFEKIQAGACLVQGYTGFVYHGPAYARDINRGLNNLLEQNGFGNLDEAVGSRV